jgi:hypothetical protein
MVLNVCYFYLKFEKFCVRSRGVPLEFITCTSSYNDRLFGEQFSINQYKIGTKSNVQKMDDFSDCESTKSTVAHTKHHSAINIENTRVIFLELTFPRNNKLAIWYYL